MNLNIGLAHGWSCWRIYNAARIGSHENAAGRRLGRSEWGGSAPRMLMNSEMFAINVPREEIEINDVIFKGVLYKEASSST